MTVERAEAGRGQRFIDRSVRINPRITTRDALCKASELFWKLRIEQIRVTGTASVMKQTDNGTNT
jgi:hypothetical protein